MKFVNNILCIEHQELLDMGIPKGTLDFARNKGSQTWKFIKDPDDKRKVLVEYEGLKPRYQELVIDEICGGVDPYAFFNTQILNQHLFSKVDDVQFFDDFTINGAYLKSNTYMQAVEACKYLYFLERHQLATAKKAAFPFWKVDEFWGNTITHIRGNAQLRAKQGVNLPASRAKLNSMMKAYIADGPGVVLSHKLGNKNSSKLGKIVQGEALSKGFDPDVYEKQIAVLTELRGNTNNLQISAICKLYNKIAVTQSWPELTVQAVEKTIKNGLINRVTLPGRRGTKHYLNNATRQIKRKRPELAMQYLTVDGWNVELGYQDYVGNQTKYHLRQLVVVVLDPCINYPLGYAIADRETPALIKAAIKNAIDHARELTGTWIAPQKIQTDNYQIKNLTPYYEAVADAHARVAVGNAKSKVVEPYFNYLNMQYCQMFPNWTGINLTSSSKNQPNMEWKDMNKKNLPDKEQNTAEIVAIIEQERLKKIDEYRAITDPDKILTITRQKYLEIYGETTKKTIALRGEGIAPEIDGVKYWYDTFDLSFRNLSHLNWQLHFDRSNMSTILATAEDGKYKFLLEQQRVVPMNSNDESPEDYAYRQAIRSHKKQDMRMITEARAASGAIVAEIIEETPAIQNDTVLKMVLNKDALADAKGLLGGGEKKKAIQAEQKQQKKDRRDIEREHEEYINSKDIDFDDYL